jgi:hypothetical protein
VWVDDTADELMLGREWVASCELRQANQWQLSR